MPPRLALTSLSVCLALACVGAAFVAVPRAFAAGRDDTAWLQARLDAGGTLFLPKLPNGECYATLGLWVSRDGTSVTSDGACMVALGRGEARMKTGAGVPVRATAVFFLNHSNIFDPLPVRVTLSGLDIRVPAAKRMAGVEVFGHEVTLSRVRISGGPTADVVIGAGKIGAGGMTARIAILDCVLSGGKRDIVTAYGPVGLRVERSTLSGGAHLAGFRPAAGLHIRAGDRGQPTLDVHVVGNRMLDNAGPGIFLDLDPKNGLPILASGIELRGNEVRRNGAEAAGPDRGGIVLAGGQNDGKGSVALRGNVVRGNWGPGLHGRKLALALAASANDLRFNSGGASRGLRATAAARPAAPSPATKPASGTSGGARDDTDWLQRRLDVGGGTVFLQRLPNGACYRTRGLWVSHDGTTVDSDGACIVSLGHGPVRLHSIDGDPITSNAVFFVNRSSRLRPAPIRVTISNLRIVVPRAQGMFGVGIFGHRVTLNHLEIAGSPIDDVLIGGRANGNGYVGQVAVLGSVLSGAERNAISAFGVIGLRIDGNTIQGVRDGPPSQPGAGIDVEPDDRGQPTLDLRITRNTISDNAGPGVLLELDSNSGPAAIADDLEISDNIIVRNAFGRWPPKRAGIVLAGGQDGGEGKLLLARNSIRGNGGPGVLGTHLKLDVAGSANDLSGNAGGTTSGLRH